MKSIFISALSLLLFAGAKAQQQKDVQQTKADQLQTADFLSMKETLHDFGYIPQGKPVYYYFGIANTGLTPLKLENVQASCGCTTPEWSKEPIAAGATGKIKVGFNAASPGHFDKFITITYNGNQTKQVHITGTVWTAPQGSAPANASIQFLKQQIQ